MSNASIGEQLFVTFQQWLPTRALSTLIHRIAHLRAPWLKNRLISAFMSSYDISLDEADIGNPRQFSHFNAFFTRALKAGARPLEGDESTLVSPADGRVSSFGRIEQGKLLQAKGQDYELSALLGGRDDLARQFLDGDWCTIYLAPFNYHRVHMPIDGDLRETLYVPGRLFSVNAATARGIPRLFARNERVIAIFDTAAGPLAVILVGALLVGSVDTVWAGRITPPHRRSPKVVTLPPCSTSLKRGDELGRFNMGSTVILLGAPGALRFAENMAEDLVVRVGQTLAQYGAPHA